MELNLPAIVFDHWKMQQAFCAGCDAVSCSYDEMVHQGKMTCYRGEIFKSIRDLLADTEKVILFFLADSRRAESA